MRRQATRRSGNIKRRRQGWGLPDRPFVAASGSRAFAGLKLVVEQSETVLEDYFYSATTVFGRQEKNYGPLYFLKTCPQPPDIQAMPPTISRSE